MKDNQGPALQVDKLNKIIINTCTGQLMQKCSFEIIQEDILVVIQKYWFQMNQLFFGVCVCVLGGVRG